MAISFLVLQDKIMEDLTKRLKILKEKIEDLRVKYENYFAGFEKIPPIKLHEEVSKEINALVGNTSMSYGLQYLLNQIAQRFRTYESLWEKQMKKREEGLLNKKRVEGRAFAYPQTREFFKFSSGSEKEEIKKLYQDFVKNSGKIGGKTVSFEQFERYIFQQVNTLKKKFSCSSVVVWIEKEGDTAKIKAKPE
jgi:hypothetical protein